MTKAEARGEARVRLSRLDDAARRAASEAIAASVWSVPEIAAARTLLLYASRPDEVGTDAIASEARARGVTITYPRCLPETVEMALHRLDGVHELLDGGAYGIREPGPACPVVAVHEIDAVLVPGLAWDRDGTRLGRGRGYYDRLFADPAWRGLRCGLFFAAQELSDLPRDPWDAAMDIVVTEREVWRAIG